MGTLPVIVPGRVCERRQADGKITGWKLQRWHEGHNETRHIPTPMLDRVRQGTDGYKRFMTLADEFAELRGREVLGTPDTASDSKKSP